MAEVEPENEELCDPETCDPDIVGLLDIDAEKDCVIVTVEVLLCVTDGEGDPYDFEVLRVSPDGEIDPVVDAETVVVSVRVDVPLNDRVRDRVIGRLRDFDREISVMDIDNDGREDETDWLVDGDWLSV